MLQVLDKAEFLRHNQDRGASYPNVQNLLMRLHRRLMHMNSGARLHRVHQRLQQVRDVKI
jgi:hypothetical protein